MRLVSWSSSSATDQHQAAVPHQQPKPLPVGLLEPGTSTLTTKLLPAELLVIMSPALQVDQTYGSHRRLSATSRVRSYWTSACFSVFLLASSTNFWSKDRSQSIPSLQPRQVIARTVGNQSLGDGLSDGVDLRCVATTGDADADVDVYVGSVSDVVGERI